MWETKLWQLYPSSPFGRVSPWGSGERALPSTSTARCVHTFGLAYHVCMMSASGALSCLQYESRPSDVTTLEPSGHACAWLFGDPHCPQVSSKGNPIKYPVCSTHSSRACHPVFVVALAGFIPATLVVGLVPPQCARVPQHFGA
ncbi:hypothetical protein JAAARDRAFT_347217 [Jaapia argillacea MUCL 33604]|uniref:Uncharacterized protein n=1 Tax=Jaapia argillacea MUCL 33604 TaxID=933084 RepID=A0A067PWM3_9AGAM|nr:hypothetical protein JAAARDRAFT_347217 [Jaapia argillacea MUCL 33604]